VETQESIHQWIDETFPGTDPHSPRKSLRALEEMVELCLASGASAQDIMDAARGATRWDKDWTLRETKPEQIPIEAADVLIVLYGVAGMRGFDLHAEVDRKMATNRKRKWRVRGDGTGYHVKEP